MGYTKEGRRKEEGPVCGLCSSCKWFLVEKGSSDPYKCDAPTSATAQNKWAFSNSDRTKRISPSECKAYEQGSPGSGKSAGNSYKGKWGVGAGLGQMLNSAGLDDRPANLENLAGGAAKVGIGLVAGAAGLVGVGIGAAVKAAKKAAAEKKAKEESEETARAAGEAAYKALPACDDPVSLMAEQDGYTSVAFDDFRDGKDYHEFKGRRLKSVVTVACSSDYDDYSEDDYSEFKFYAAEHRDDIYNEVSLKYPGPYLELKKGEDYLIYYTEEHIEKLVRLTPAGSAAWDAVSAAASTAPAGGAVCSCGTPLVPEARFCPACGKPVPAALVCGSCGAPLPAEAKFCGKCGTPAA
jgi:hypothetical protein